MKVAFYIRVSTEDQVKEGYSLEVQREYLENFAKREGWKVIQPIYEDDGISGYSLERPGLRRLLSDASKKKFQLVLVYKLDRFSRKLKDLLNLVECLDSYGVAFKSATEPFDTATSAGKLMFQQLGSFAEFERNRIAERVFPGMVKGVQKGNWQGARYSPYGYRYNKRKKLLEVVPQEAEVVRFIYKRYLQGQGVIQIAGYLYEKGYKTRSGGRFHSKLVYDILKNQVYLGKIVWNKYHYSKKQKTSKGYRYIRNHPSEVIIAQGRHQPLISQEVFDKVQIKLIKNRRGNTGRMTSSDYPLTGVIICGNCGHRYYGFSCISNHRTKAKKRWYRCSGREYGIKCGNPCVRAEVIEPQVFKIVEFIANHEDVRARRIENLIISQTNVDGGVKTEIEGKEKELKKNLAKQGKLTDAYLEGNVAVEVYREKSGLLRDEEENLKKVIARLKVRLIERERSEDYKLRLQQVITDFEETKKYLSPIEKKQFLQLIFKRAVIKDGKLVDYELYEPFKTLMKEVESKWLERPPLLTVESQSCILKHTDAR